MAWKPLILPRPEHQDQAHITKEMISKLSRLELLLRRAKNRANGFQCPFCFEDCYWHCKIFKNKTGLWRHLYTAHTLSMTEIDDFKKILDSFQGNSFVKHYEECRRK